MWWGGGCAKMCKYCPGFIFKKNYNANYEKPWLNRMFKILSIYHNACFTMSTHALTDVHSKWSVMPQTLNFPLHGSLCGRVHIVPLTMYHLIVLAMDVLVDVCFISTLNTCIHFHPLHCTALHHKCIAYLPILCLWMWINASSSCNGLAWNKPTSHCLICLQTLVSSSRR